MSRTHSVTGTPGPLADLQREAATDGAGKFRPGLKNSWIHFVYAGLRESVSISPTPAGFSLAKEAEEEDVQVKAQEQDGVHEQISAADYDPSLDRREDEQKRVLGVKDEPEDVQVMEEEEEEDVDDMFAVATSDKPKVKKVKKVLVSHRFLSYL